MIENVKKFAARVLNPKGKEVDQKIVEKLEKLALRESYGPTMVESKEDPSIKETLFSKNETAYSLDVQMFEN